LAKPAIPFAPGAGAVKLDYKKWPGDANAVGPKRKENCGWHHMTRSALIITGSAPDNIPCSGRIGRCNKELELSRSGIKFGNKGLRSEVL
jgi:hypothetical protein